MSEVIITVRGEHETRVAPEEAVVHLSVRAEGPERGPVVEQISALTAPLRDDLAARKLAGGVSDWSSQRVSLWANRPWNSEGKQLALVHYASVEVTATFTDIAALSWWMTEVAQRDGVQIDNLVWRLSPDSARLTEGAVASQAVRVAVDRATAYAAAIGLTTVTPLEIADLGLLGRGENPPQAPQPRMMAMAKASFDTAGGAPAMEFQPEDIVVSAAVEARFSAR
ncbi:SIMPL domain-containing protein [Microbacterium aoyamense]|uniref:SIMPL domain-containing protein n=1 Tax=Microbacterium aoyamense TaxID=344166 RepID=A0ABN2PWV1_9MICO|nr:SIMPL domain-containing protein [Microbacterium aoyamense]